MRISDWSSDVCSSDLVIAIDAEPVAAGKPLQLGVHARAQAGRSRRGLRVECLDSVAVLSLDGGAGATTLEIPTRRRGWLDPGRLRISTTRPLGLARAWEIGRAHVCTPVTNAQLVCRLLLAKQNNRQ